MTLESLERIVLFEKTPYKVKIKSNIDFGGWWCEKYQGEFFYIKEASLAELIAAGYNIQAFNSLNIKNNMNIYDYFLTNEPKQHPKFGLALPKKFCTTISGSK